MTPKHSRGVRRALIGTVALAGTLAACDSEEILRVQDPDVVRPVNVSDSSALPLLLAGALSDFQVAYNGGNGALATEGQVNFVGLFTDEFIQTESFPTRTEVELRGIGRDNTTMGPAFLDLSRARAAAERVARKYDEFGQPGAVGRAEALALARRLTPEPGLICVTGSLFLAAEARALVLPEAHTHSLQSRALT